MTLTRKFLQSIEEVETINKILNKKYDFFQRLKADCEIFEEQDKENNVTPNNPDGKTSVERASWAVNMIREQLNESSFVLNELTRSMNVVSKSIIRCHIHPRISHVSFRWNSSSFIQLIHIRTIEQNELSIVRDGQERAIRLFTGVTIVFLILSFCTSYFGMQLEGIVGTTRTEAYFWYVCGTSTLTILLLFTLYTFRSQLREHFRKRNRRIQLDL